jgi:PAS domain-containing protein
MDALAEAGRALAELKPIASPGAVPVLEVDRLWQVLVGASAEILNATRATRHAEARYRSIVNTAVDAMVVIDETGCLCQRTTGSSFFCVHISETKIFVHTMRRRALCGAEGRIRHDRTWTA